MCVCGGGGHLSITTCDFCYYSVLLSIFSMFTCCLNPARLWATVQFQPPPPHMWETSTTPNSPLPPWAFSQPSVPERHRPLER